MGDEKLKKPASAYFIYANENRKEIQQQLGTKDLGQITKKTCEMWKGLSDSARKPWEDKAKAQKDAYDKFILSPEGAAALQAYKAQVKEAKDDIKGKRAAESDVPEQSEQRHHRRALDVILSRRCSSCSFTACHRGSSTGRLEATSLRRRGNIACVCNVPEIALYSRSVYTQCRCREQIRTITKTT